MKKQLLLLIIVLTSLTQAEAVDNDFKIGLGGYLFTHKEDASLSLADAIGTDISFQDDLGLNKSIESFRLSAQYNFNDLHKVVFSYYILRTDNTRIIEEDIIYNDNLYKAGAEISSKLHLDVYKLNYGYTFYTTDDLEISATIGVHALYIDTELVGDATLDDNTIVSQKRSDFNGLAPLPVIGLRMEYALTSDIDLYASMDYFDLTIDEYSGSLEDFYIGGEYQVTENVGIGLGFNMTNLDLEIDEEDDNQRYTLEQKISGTFVYLSYTF